MLPNLFAGLISLVLILTSVPAVQPNSADTTLTDTSIPLTVSGTISGTVYDQDGVTPMVRSGVRAIHQGTGAYSYGTTDTEGVYSITGLPAGDYRLNTNQDGYVKEYYGGSYDFNEAILISVVSSDVISGIDFTIEPGGAVAGHVYEADGFTPIEGAPVNVMGITIPCSFTCYTEADGSYTVDGLATGSYQVRASQSGFVMEYYPGTHHLGEAGTVSVDMPATTSGIDLLLDEGGKISGTVYASDGVTPVVNAKIEATCSDETAGYTWWSFSDAAGHYAFDTLQSNDYWLKISADGFYPEIYNHKPTQFDADLISVTIPEEVTGIDFILQETSGISGYVYDADGDPLAGASVALYTIDQDFVAQTTASGIGEYTLSGILPGQYLIKAFEPNTINDDFLRGMKFLSGIPITVTSEAPLQNIDLTPTPGGVIGGRIFQAAAPLIQPIEGVRVGISDNYGTELLTAFSIENGCYAFADLPADDYLISAYWPDHYLMYYNGSYSEDGATLLHSETGTVMLEANVIFSPGGIISGTVYESDGTTPVPDVTVEVYTTTTPEIFSVTTLEDGSYTLSGLPPADYTVRTCKPGYVEQYYDSAQSSTEATPVTVPTDGTALGIDFSLIRGSVISGTVYSDDGITPIENAAMYAESLATGTIYSTYSTYSDGSYSFNMLPEGYYYIWASPLNGIGEYYDSASNKDSATLVRASLSGETTGIDFTITYWASISGRIFQSDGTSPLAGANVALQYSYNGQPGSYFIVTSDQDGNYDYTGIFPGDYVLWVSHDNYQKQYYSNANSWENAETLSILSGESRIGIDLVMQPGCIISGTVFEDDGITPIEDFDVRAESVTTGISYWCYFTNSDGSYSFTTLPEGNYNIRASSTGHITEYYDDAPNVNSATPVEASLSGETTGIDFDLTSWASISGRIFQSDGTSPLAGANVALQYSYDGQPGSFMFATSEPDGTYTFTNIYPDDYVIWVMHDSYQKQYYSNAYSWETAETISIASGESLTGIDLVMKSGSILSGTVVEDDGITPIPGCFIRAQNVSTAAIKGAYTDNYGHYSIGELSPGNYKLYTDIEGYAMEYYNGSYNIDFCTQVTVAEDEIVSSLDFQLSPGGTLSGHVYQADGTTPVSSGNIFAQCDVSITTFRTTIAPDGSYTLSELPPGNFILWTSACGFISEYYQDAESYATATQVTVGLSEAISSIDFLLAEAGFVSGRIYDSDGATPLSGMGVTAYATNDGKAYYSSGSDDDGYYTFCELPAGDYYIRAFGKDYLSTYYGETTSQDQASPITVTIPTNITGIDIVMMEATNVIPGDANEDSVVNVLDITKISRMILGLDTTTPGADADQNGSVNVMDVTRVVMMILGLD